MFTTFFNTGNDVAKTLVCKNSLFDRMMFQRDPQYHPPEPLLKGTLLL